MSQKSIDQTCNRSFRFYPLSGINFGKKITDVEVLGAFERDSNMPAAAFVSGGIIAAGFIAAITIKSNSSKIVDFVLGTDYQQKAHQRKIDVVSDNIMISIM